MKELILGLLQVSLLQAWVPTATGIWYWNSPGWSLGSEAFFYLMFPLAGALIWRGSHDVPKTSLLIGVCWVIVMAIPLSSVAASIKGCTIAATYEEQHSFYFNLIRFDPLLRLPEFLSGILACRLYLHLKPAWEAKGYWFYLPAATAILSLISFLADKLPYILLTNGLVLPATVMFIVGVALGGGLVVRLFSIRTMGFLGGASYSMYLLHAPIRLWILKFHVVGLSTAYGSLAYICLVIATSSIVFRYIEEPTNLVIRSAFDKNWARRCVVAVTARSAISVGWNRLVSSTQAADVDPPVEGAKLSQPVRLR